jgi:hypothetical protein
MARGACKFRQSELTRAAKALRAAGFNSVRIILNSGGAEVLANEAYERSPLGDEAPLDKWLSNRARQA